ncbi:mannose-1-phosphate guanylyltransferase/mannose-6-phosphate isomerase [Ramlibacter sp. H39-3-26]|uniref:mannose-1-phosphate guanylyltransferase/mannose-6-phosphate isomerase n=1 Tax=Curvibacter soli TaxID=3031331 RepID=UPI0023DA9911|nr:mannose-1-phosphate guanylyltransferase/mannose-6-phosphate isomerase [Ramlibacter sp. H39-3-26]MDF1485188.1 mannose-1-phosphate guanylyltransferase/mannose-6-phosphate isomerase [Ramlibacter sp. H39-3-26]
MVIPVILCGGSGTRLWPLSRKAFPKQFVPLINGKSLLQITLERMAAINVDDGLSDVLCVAFEGHRFLVLDALQTAMVSGAIILEPIGKNTAPAMALAALSVDPDEILLFCPSDHYIPDVKEFSTMIGQACAAAHADSIVVFGIQPTYPSSAYGYIQRDAVKIFNGHRVSRFIEKPNAIDAAALILEGNALWNSGIFLCRANTLLSALQQHAPDILESCKLAMKNVALDEQFMRPDPNVFSSCRAESIDYAVMEHCDNIIVVPFRGAWSDVGSWNAVAELTPPDVRGNRIVGQGLAVESDRTYIYAPHRPVVALGTQDVMIIDTPDALLVVAHNSVEKVKGVVAKLEALDTPQAGHHRKVSRPWGWYDRIDSGDRFQVKRIMVKPGASLSLQLHHHRAEHWIVVQGTAEVTCGSEVVLLTENQSTYIPIGKIHRLSNPGRIILEMIEIQSGGYLGEDDIVRLDDKYGRISPS